MFRKLLATIVQFIADLLKASPGSVHGPKPAPAPSEEQIPPANHTLSSGDDIDPNDIEFDEPLSPAKWPITATLSDVSIDAKRIHAKRTGAVWPRILEKGWDKPSIGNWWLIRRCEDGRWHGATMEWLGAETISVAIPRGLGTSDIHGPVGMLPPPAPGEQIGVMQSTFGGRDGQTRGISPQRTQIKLLTVG